PTPPAAASSPAPSKPPRSATSSRKPRASAESATPPTRVRSCGGRLKWWRSFPRPRQDGTTSRRDGECGIHRAIRVALNPTLPPSGRIWAHLWPPSPAQRQARADNRPPMPRVPADLVALSRHLGEESRDYTILGEGNTSCL